MVEPQSFIFKGCIVYNLDDLIQFDQAYFYGCLKRKREVLIKKNISLDDYFYAKITKEGWKESISSYSRAKILIKSEWVKSNVTKFIDTSVGVCEKVLREAPPILELEDCEKFRDDIGNVFEVEVRGVREEDKIYFKAIDIEKLFEMENLVKNIVHEFHNIKDYEKFLVIQSRTNYEYGTEEEKRVKRTFFTYNGLLKVIFRSNSGTGYKFRKWATKVVYTAHLGTEEQRFEQALDIAGVNANLVKQVFDTCVTQVPCVYLFYIGRVSKMVKYYPELKEYRTGMLYKYGMTKSLHRRLMEHIRDYGQLHQNNLKLCQWSPINEKCISKAETSLSRYFKNKKVAFQGHDEVIILSRTDTVEVKNKYTEVYNTFGIVTEMAKIMVKNDKLVENHKYQKMLLQEKDARIAELNREINGYTQREKEWKIKEKEWKHLESKFLNREQELMTQNTLLLKQLSINK
ncbi:BRO-like protein [Invertebrate iridescent virus 22]|uniref:BRO-like protein n=1 Tax=Invertebrate iridescent virus 22 TaxID=345198 RepID=S6DCZ8_9VIRU|nr:BRO-like protein [Invertebrate iridescent virus 22]CCV01807.1 BRO-like protein [Invertebrate iridescent virus 22]